MANKVKISSTEIARINTKGASYYEAKQVKLAAQYFQRAINLSPKHPEAYHHFGVLYRDCYKDYELSRLYLQKAIRLDKKYFDNYYQLALTYIKEDDKESAKDALNVCLALKPDYKKASELLEKLS